MKILAVETELKKPDLNTGKEILKEEALAVFNMYLQDFIREIYFNDQHCAVLILECTDIQEAESKLNELPLVKNGYIEFQLTTLKPYTGFNRLF